jgi:hypothetical protein
MIEKENDKSQSISFDELRNQIGVMKCRIRKTGDSRIDNII